MNETLPHHPLNLLSYQVLIQNTLHPCPSFQWHTQYSGSCPRMIKQLFNSGRRIRSRYRAFTAELSYPKMLRCIVMVDRSFIRLWPLTTWRLTTPDGEVVINTRHMSFVFDVPSSQYSVAAITFTNMNKQAAKWYSNRKDPRYVIFVLHLGTFSLRKPLTLASSSAPSFYSAVNMLYAGVIRREIARLVCPLPRSLIALLDDMPLSDELGNKTR
jgi:hypothetical protein